MRSLWTFVCLWVFLLTASSNQSPLNPNPPHNPFTPLDDALSPLEIKYLPTQPLTSSWARFAFMPLEKSIPIGEIFIFVLNPNPPLDSDCTLPAPILGNLPKLSRDFFPPTLSSRPACIATHPDDIDMLSPMNAGYLVTATDDTFGCNFQFVPAATVPVSWTVTCLVQFPSNQNRGFDSAAKIALIRAAPAVHFQVKNTVYSPLVSKSKSTLIWLDLELDYEGGRTEEYQRIDYLKLRFTNLPPNISFGLDLALDVSEDNHLDRIYYLPLSITTHIAELIASTKLPLTNIHDHGARLVFSSSLYANGFFIVTGSKAPDVAEFTIPIPIFTIMGLMAGDVKLHATFDQWDGKQIAAYVRLDQSRLFRVETTDPLATWNFQSPLLHQYVYNSTYNLVFADWNRGVINDLSFHFHFVVMGPNPTFQITGFHGPKEITYGKIRSAFRKLFTLAVSPSNGPPGDNGLFTGASFSPSPMNNHIDQDDTTRKSIPLQLYAPSTDGDGDDDASMPSFPLEPIQFVFGENGYFGYANITVGFMFSGIGLFPFSIDLLLNGHYKHSISVYPGVTQTNALPEVSESKLRHQILLTPSNELRFHGVLLNLTGLLVYMDQDHQFNILPLHPFQIPTRWTFSLTELEFSPYEIRPLDQLTAQDCTGSFVDSTTREELTQQQLQALFEKYGLPLPNPPIVPITRGRVDALSALLTPDQTDWMEFTTYLFPNTSFALTCEYQLSPTLNKPLQIIPSYTISTQHGDAFVKPPSPTVFTPSSDQWSTKPSLPTAFMTVHAAFPIYSEAQYQQVIDIVLEILKSAEVTPGQSPAFADITRDDLYIPAAVNRAYPLPGTSYQYSAQFPSTLDQTSNADDHGDETLVQSVYNFGRYVDTAVLLLAVPVSAEVSPQNLSAHTFVPRSKVTLFSVLLDDGLLLQKPTFSGAHDSAQIKLLTAPMPQFAHCLSSSQCDNIHDSRGDIIPSRCVHNRCIAKYNVPTLTVDERYFLTQAQLRRNWLSSFYIPELPNEEIPHKSNFKLFLLLALGIGALVIVITYGLISFIQNRRKQRKADLELRSLRTGLLPDDDQQSLN